MANAIRTSPMVSGRYLTVDAFDRAPMLLATIPNWPAKALNTIAVRTRFASGREKFLGPLAESAAGLITKAATTGGPC